MVTLLERALPALPARLTPQQAFTRGLGLCYACAVRVESGQRGTEPVASEVRAYRHRLHAALPWLPYATRQLPDGALHFQVPLSQRRGARMAWRLRRLQGKLLSLLRLLKATFTFRDAIDYAAWKIGRHTGETVEPQPLPGDLRLGTAVAASSPAHHSLIRVTAIASDRSMRPHGAAAVVPLAESVAGTTLPPSIR